jgi:hypothetical protein
MAYGFAQVLPAREMLAKAITADDRAFEAALPHLRTVAELHMNFIFLPLIFLWVATLWGEKLSPRRR